MRVTSSFPHHLRRNKILRQHAMGSLWQCGQGAGSRATYAESADVLLFLDHNHDRLNHHARLQTQRTRLLGLRVHAPSRSAPLRPRRQGSWPHNLRARAQVQVSNCAAELLLGRDGHAHSFWQSKDTVALSVSMSQ